MNLHSNNPYWLLKNGIIADYPSLNSNMSTDVVVIGAGITGALVARELGQRGVPTIVLDRRHVAFGSTAASTSLLQYEIDTPLHLLRKKVGARNADRSYLLCRESLYNLAETCKQLALKTDFVWRHSFQHASFPSHVAALRKEYDARKSIGIAVEFLEASDVEKRFHFTAPAGLLSEEGGHVDAYRLTHALLQSAEQKGVRIFDHSEVNSIEHTKRGIQLKANDTFSVKAKKLVIACGYESQQYLPHKIEELASTFAIVSEPMSKREFWEQNALIWETATPYLYIKITEDYRLIVGGKDVPLHDPAKRDAMVKSKSKQLVKGFNKLFPDIQVKTDFQWAGTFSSSKDGLPYIGSIPQRPNTFFALGFGGNGITFSQIAARLIGDELTDKHNPDMEVFSFNR